MSGITSHVLDTALGRPATGLRVRVEARDPGGAWELLAERVTNADGRVSDLLAALERRVYRLTFDTGPYLEVTHGTAFYPYVEVVFEVLAPDEHYHVPLLLSPYGYATYRGS